MPPKKREKEPEVMAASGLTQKQLNSQSTGQLQTPARMDQIQADHELFLQAFESEFFHSFIILQLFRGVLFPFLNSCIHSRSIWYSDEDEASLPGCFVEKEREGRT